MIPFLSIAQITISIVLIVLILLQERGGGTSGIFGGGEGGYYQARRGLERGIFIATVIGVVLFAGLSLLNLVVS